MPKRTDLHSIAIIGAGPIRIGQACEFDYAGTQACKSLKEEGYRVILVNSNPATIMTDPELADATYLEPITHDIVGQILEYERPDAILPTMGGQTALNLACSLAESRVLERLGIEMIGADQAVIAKAEDRQQFRAAMERIGLAVPCGEVASNLDQALDILGRIGLPAVVRPSYTLGGSGGGIACSEAEFCEIVSCGLRTSPSHQVLIEESVLGWKEFEMEVVRDRADNCIVVCSIENLDPMGVHTGDSITVAPALTLTDKEYQQLRNASIAVLREIGVDTGGSNVQFAIEPTCGRMLVIEMNPRVSRSSALASKATGFPIAKVAAKLAVGYTLDELQNDITAVIPASFEPTIDYVVTKLPRFAFEKFPETEPILTTSMKSVGEAMAIGRNFAESLQKGLRSLETGLTGLNRPRGELALEQLQKASPERILWIAQAFREEMSPESVQQASGYDPWFLGQIQALVMAEAELQRHGMPTTAWRWLRFKQLGFSDARLAELTGVGEEDIASARRQLGVRPVYKRVDSCAGEFHSATPYLYSTYERAPDGQPAGCEAEPSSRAKVIILGSGPNRIGQGIEFDYCCVHAAYGLRQAGLETVMVNCNPETVSTDYDTSDRLYFEPLTAEDVIELVEVEQRCGKVLGVIVQLGGQTPLKLAKALIQHIPVLGTPHDAIDRAEDRERFQQTLHSCKLPQPRNGLAHSAIQARELVAELGYPAVIRPSYVLGGRAMAIIHDQTGLSNILDQAFALSPLNSVLIEEYLQEAIEVDVDVLAEIRDGIEHVHVAGVLEHIEQAGIHSGDSACALPPHTLSSQVVEQICHQSGLLARELGIVGLMNVQFAIRDDSIFVLEVNPRASRTVPFVAKATGQPIAKIAARVMAGERLQDFSLPVLQRLPYTTAFTGIPHTAVKEAVFPFIRFPGVDTLLGPEMKSTGEVMGIDSDFSRAFAKSQLGTGVPLPEPGRAFISVKDRDKPAAAELARSLIAKGFSITATCNTAAALIKAGLPAIPVNKVREGKPDIIDAMLDREHPICLIINTVESRRSVRDGLTLRRMALANDIPYYTTLAQAQVAVESLGAISQLVPKSLQAYLAESKATRPQHLAYSGAEPK